MNATAKFEGAGAELAEECLDNVLSSDDQASNYGYVLALLNNLSGCGQAENGARRGAAMVLVNVIERGLEAIRSDRSR